VRLDRCRRTEEARKGPTHAVQDTGLLIQDEEFAGAAGSLGVALSPEALQLFDRYEEHIRRWSGRVRLVSRGDRGKLRERHFLESLAVVPLLPAEPHAVLDLGSGAGLPGVPVAIVRPDVRVVLLESTRMKALFLSDLRDRLGIANLEVVRGRAEDVGREPEHCGRYRIVLSRALGVLPYVWEMSAPFLDPGGQALALKGPGSLSEFGSSRPEALSVAELRVTIPITGQELSLVTMRPASPPPD
jgi:16S rRNA (guanine527-N7)-methyltransferase